MKKNLIYLAAIALSAVGIAAYVGRWNHTSINPTVQSVFQSKIDGAITEYKAKGAVAILMNAKNGEIVAMYSAPEDKSILNQTFEFGGILSLFNPILAMENGIDANRQYDVSKPFTPTQSSMNITEITINSSNIGSAQIALDLPQNAYGELFARLRMNAPLNLDFGQSAAPNIPSQWRKTDRINASLGHGVFITPIHLMAVSNAIINDGIYVAPWTMHPQSGERVIASEHSVVIRDIMHKIAVKVWNDDMNVGIKSASATQTDTKDIVTSAFAAFPIDNPKYSLLIIVDSPQQQYKTAAWNAVPLTKSILTEIIPML